MTDAAVWMFFASCFLTGWLLGARVRSLREASTLYGHGDAWAAKSRRRRR